MKSIFAKTFAAVFSACVLILIILTLSACGNGYEKITDGVLEYYVSGESVCVVDCDEDGKEVEIPSTVFYKEEYLPVTEISSHAFAGCERLEKVKIPASVTSIASSAFTGCLSLTELIVSPENPVYHSAGNCLIETDTKTLICGFPSSVIPADGSVEVIGGRAFYGCVGLEEVTVPASVTKIGSGAFENCPDLKSVTVEEGNGSYSGADGILYDTGKTEILLIPARLEGEIAVADGLEKIEDNAFDGRSGIVKLTLPNTLKSIGAYAFSGCSGLEELVIPNSVTEIGEGVFAKCAALNSLEIPFVGSLNNVGAGSYFLFGNMFGKDSFEGGFCVTQNFRISYYASGSGNTNYYLPKSLSKVKVNGGSLRECAFLNCKSIREITLGANVESVDGCAFYFCEGLNKLAVENADCITQTETFKGMENVTNATLPAGALENFGEKNLKNLNYAVIFGDGEIADKTFEGSSLVRVVIADGITKIGKSAFEGSLKLDYVHLADSVDEIGSAAFRDCALLENAEIPSKVKVIREFTFKGCTSLKSVGLPEGLTEIFANSFENCTALKNITIPENVEYIGGRAFQNCTSLEKVNYNAVNCAPTKTDNSWVFSGCDNLTEVVLGEKVEYVPARLFGYCKGLRTVTGGEKVASIGETAFYQCTALESFEFSGEQTAIGNQAFEYCSSLESICVNAVEIDNFAFMYCSSLKTVILGSATESIREYVFRECSLERVFYEGNAEEWRGVYKSVGFDTATADAVIYYYSEERPATSGSFWHYADGVPQVWE